MKKFLTVLLVIAVMFTFSFGSAFAANPQTTVSDREAAMAKITEKYTAITNDQNNGTLDVALAVAKNAKPDGVATEAWSKACQDAYDAVKAEVDTQLAQAYQKFGKAEQDAQAYEYGIQGYDFASAAVTPTDGYVYFADALAAIDLAKVKSSYWDNANGKLNVTVTTDVAEKAAYETALDKALKAIQSYNLEQYAKDDKVAFTIDGKSVTKSSYEWAAIAQSDALAYLGALGEYGTTVTINGVAVPCVKATVDDVYTLHHAGTAAASITGSFAEEKPNVHPALAALKTVTVITTDKAKIEYAKAKFIADVKAAIQGQRVAELDAQNKIIFAQTVAVKPNQAAIDKANEEIEKINKKYDAMTEVWEYRLNNVEYRVVKEADKSEVIRAYYDDAAYNVSSASNAIGKFVNNVFEYVAPFNDGVQIADLTPVLTADKAVQIVEDIEDLKAEAEVLKASVGINGATILDVENALNDAIDTTYMTGTKANISMSFTDTVVHVNAHKLLGTACKEYGVTANKKVTVDDKSYDTVANWTTSGYSTNNKAAVKTIISDAKAAIKEAKTVADANKAFVDAYAKYDAVITVAEQAALFNYSGALYGKDKAAAAELNAYIDYKVTLAGKDAPATTTAAEMKDYFGINAPITSAGLPAYLEEVTDEASLQAAIADVKAAADSLKTKAALKAEGDALVKEATAVKRAVTIEQRDEVLALYDKINAFIDYCDMTGYSDTVVQPSKGLVATDIQRLEDLEKAQLDAMKKALGDVRKLTLAQEDAVNAFVDAQDAYNGRYGVDGDYADALGAGAAKDYVEADAYDEQIFQLKLNEARKLIAALPTYPTTAQVVAAQKAVDALGFRGICEIGDYYLTKLSKFDQDAEKNVVDNVAALKITASSSAKKGSITVKWTVKGDATGVEAYEIWKSTKKNSGFKKAFTTTKKSYKNTKGLKKGTRYYYKVRAIAHVDGDKITSDWSNKAYRKAK